MEKFRRITDMLEGELEHIQERGELNAATLAQADTIAHTLKSLATYEAMKSQGGYSERYPYRGGSYGYDDGGSSYGRGRYAKRDSMGRYSSDDGESMDGYSNRRY